jgi:rhomboid protease GluP
MLKRQTSGSVVCSNCGRLVGVNDERCFNCGKWNPGLWGYAPMLGRLGGTLGFSQIVLGGCILLFLLSYLYAPRQGGGGILRILSPDSSSLYKFGASGALPVFVAGRWWTVLSAAWLHGGILHIFMNMWCLRSLMPLVAELYGTSRLVIIYTVSSITGFLLTSVLGYAGFFLPIPGFLKGATITVGASAPLMGLAGALIYYGRRTGSRALTQQIVQWVLILVVFGFFVGFVDNWAHLGGLAGGYLAALWLDPLRPEKPGHMLAALACLALTLLSLVLAFFAGPSWQELMASIGR